MKLSFEAIVVLVLLAVGAFVYLSSDGSMNCGRLDSDHPDCVGQNP